MRSISTVRRHQYEDDALAIGGRVDDGIHRIDDRLLQHHAGPLDRPVRILIMDGPHQVVGQARHLRALPLHQAQRLADPRIADADQPLQYHRDVRQHRKRIAQFVREFRHCFGDLLLTLGQRIACAAQREHVFAQVGAVAQHFHVALQRTGLVADRDGRARRPERRTVRAPHPAVVLAVRAGAGRLAFKPGYAARHVVGQEQRLQWPTQDRFERIAEYPQRGRVGPADRGVRSRQEYRAQVVLPYAGHQQALQGGLIALGGEWRNGRLRRRWHPGRVLVSLGREHRLSGPGVNATLCVRSRRCGAGR
jgi:hypothetical protein